MANKKTAVINHDECLGCAICIRVCRYGAITCDSRSVYAADGEKCAGCGLCAEKCPKKAIKMQNISL